MNTMLHLGKLAVIFIACPFCISTSLAQENVAKADFANVYSYKNFNDHHYIVYKAYHDSLRNIFRVGDLEKTDPLIPDAFYNIFDYYLTHDSILSLAAYKSNPVTGGKTKDTVVLAFYRYNIKTGQQLDSVPLLDLLEYKKFDAQGYLQVKKRNGTGFLTSHLKYDKTETDIGDKYLYPHTGTDFLLKRNYPPDNLFIAIFNSGAAPATGPKVRVQPDRHLIIQGPTNNIRYYTNTGAPKTEDFIKALDFKPYNKDITAATKADGGWYLITGDPLGQSLIKWPAGYAADTARHFMGYNDQLFLKIKTADRVFWGLRKVGKDSIEADFALEYADILPLFFFKDKYYLLAKKQGDDKVYLISYHQGAKKTAILDQVKNADLSKSEILIQNTSNLQCRLALMSVNGQTTDVLDLDINGNTGKVTKWDTVGTVTKYYVTEKMLALKLPRGMWYFRKNELFPKNEVRDFIKENVTSLQPYKKIELKTGKERLVAMGEQTLADKKQRTVYIDDDGKVYKTWSDWLKNNK